VMIGAAVEGALLTAAVMLEPALNKAGIWPATLKEPLSWDLGLLIKLGVDAEWFPELTVRGREVDLHESNLAEATDWLRWLRSLVHPGAFVRELPPDLEPNRTTFENAFAILDAIYEATGEALEEAFPEAFPHAP
jgi:hypothetical protein